MNTRGERTKDRIYLTEAIVRFKRDGTIVQVLYDRNNIGANVPVDSIVKFLEEKKPDVFGLSCTLSFHLHNVVNIIEKIMQNETIKDIKIIVGGYPFSVDKDLWKKVGADGFARNLSELENNLKTLLA